MKDKIRELIERGGYDKRSSNQVAMLERFAGEIIELVGKQAQSVQPHPARQYYYKMNGCKGFRPDCENCICWHDIGTGPLANEPEIQKSFRDKPQPVQPVEPIIMNCPHCFSVFDGREQLLMPETWSDQEPAQPVQPACAQEPVLQRVMGRLADLLDEDQFAEIEGIVSSAGIAPPPATVQQAESECECRNESQECTEASNCRVMNLINKSVQPVERQFNSADSMKDTLNRFDDLPEGSKADYQRSKPAVAQESMQIIPNPTEWLENLTPFSSDPVQRPDKPAPAAAINEHLLEALEEMVSVAQCVDSWEFFPSLPIERAEAAIAAAEAEKAKGGV